MCHSITICKIESVTTDFDDDEFNSAPTPFGKGGGHAFGFGGGFGGGSGMDSPTSVTPMPAPERSDRSYFQSHVRGDSAASEDSAHSGVTRLTGRSGTTFVHSSHSSIATTGTSGFTKKPSFASIRNAFKSGKNVEPPPVPQLDHQPYPVLKNPFNRSTSSLNHVAPLTSRSFANGAAASPPYHRPPTPGSSDPRFGRPTPSKSKSHTNVKSHHSQSGSIFHASDGGSDLGHGYPYSSSPPPVPRVPNAFGQVVRSDTPPTSDFEEDKIVMDPKTPSDYALHAVFMRFATGAEEKIDSFLRHTLV